jgi:hypothetical protein
VAIRYVPPTVEGGSQAHYQLLGDSNAGTYTPSFSNTSTSTQVSWTGLNETFTEAGISGFSLIVDDIQRLFDVQNSSESSHQAKINLPALTFSFVSGGF